MLYNLYSKELDKKGEKKELLHNLFEQVELTNKIINIDRNPNEIFNKILYEYSLLLVEEGLNIEASKYLINIKDIGNERIKELYERLYFNCELELGNRLSRPNPKMKLIILGQQNNQTRRANNYNNNLNQPKRFQNEIKDVPNRNTGINPLRSVQPQPFNRPIPGRSNESNSDNLTRQPPSFKNTGPFGTNQNQIAHRLWKPHFGHFHHLSQQFPIEM